MSYEIVSIFVLFLINQQASAHLLINESGIELLYNVTEYNHCLVDEFRLQLYVGRHLDDCITACALRPHCEALTYHQHGSSSLCELFQTESSERVMRTGCIYIQKKDMTIKKIPCTTECGNGTTCNMETKACDHTECASLPNITNGKLIGNLRAVGNKVQVICNLGRISRNREAVCKSDGEWGVDLFVCIRPKDCKDIFDGGKHHSGVYRIYPDGSDSAGIRVRCDMNTPPGGWTIIQRRIDASDFYKTWDEYKMGFGDLYGSYWLGNDHIWALTSHIPYRLRIELTAQDGMTGYAEYDYFSIGNETLQYALNVSGFNGDKGDSLALRHNGMKFTTMDRDNDIWDDNCGIRYHGAWWYKNCHDSNLNGDYMNDKYGMGLSWKSWRGHEESLKSTEMKIYPAQYVERF